ncbi:MAG: glutamate formimidoyltransferase [Calditrichaceae bacterium]|nr:glutamate formimidoyltransferase [Calditrichaceae bacterium]MBN2709409.1 glutamate formimidoyltransferase [Calditrichaceae bacterium]RQV93540.1 MAG: glutamate formimidoyltransferase [Calditrichota bacterium]
MEQAIIECVPNFSEGRDSKIIKQITDAIESVDGIRLLDVDPGADMNRTVVTFIGDPLGIQEAAFRAIAKAAELIDMHKHTGSHPRMGATDVCPFIPVNGIGEEDCIQLSKNVAKRVGEELNIPVYLYEKAAQIPERQNLAVIRRGEYEGLEEKLKNPQWQPDFGPAKFNARAGATVIGVREFLIAYNINLNTREVKYATDIAFELREKGRSARRGNSKPFYFKGTEILKYKEGCYPCGSCDFNGSTYEEISSHCQKEHGYDLDELLRANDISPDNLIGKSVKKPGIFEHCKAIGWMVPKYDRAQISINLTDYHVTSMHQVLEKTRKLAEERGLVVTGSEIVGMVPFQALLESGKYYLKAQQRSTGIPVMDILKTALQSLGLEDVGGFNINERVLGLPDYADATLAQMKVTDFVDEVSRESPTPGGGSIAALAGALGAALSSMVCNLTANTRGSENIDEILNAAAVEAQKIKQEMVSAIDADTRAFNAYMEARRLPSGTEEEKKIKFEAEQNGLKQAVEVPMNTAVNSYKALELAEIAVKYGNPNSVTDAGVGAQMAFSALTGGIYNVLINLKEIKDESYKNKMHSDCMELKQKARQKLEKISEMIENNF